MRAILSILLLALPVIGQHSSHGALPQMSATLGLSACASHTPIFPVAQIDAPLEDCSGCEWYATWAVSNGEEMAADAWNSNTSNPSWTSGESQGSVGLIYHIDITTAGDGTCTYNEDDQNCDEVPCNVTCTFGIYCPAGYSKARIFMVKQPQQSGQFLSATPGAGGIAYISQAFNAENCGDHQEYSSTLIQIFNATTEQWEQIESELLLSLGCEVCQIN